MLLAWLPAGCSGRDSLPSTVERKTGKASLGMDQAIDWSELWGRSPLIGQELDVGIRGLVLIILIPGCDRTIKGLTIRKLKPSYKLS